MIYKGPDDRVADGSATIESKGLIAFGPSPNHRREEERPIRKRTYIRTKKKGESEKERTCPSKKQKGEGDIRPLYDRRERGEKKKILESLPKPDTRGVKAKENSGREKNAGARKPFDARRQPSDETKRTLDALVIVILGTRHMILSAKENRRRCPSFKSG